MRLGGLNAVFVVPYCSLRERERERCLEAEKMKCLRAFFFFYNVMGRAGLDLGFFLVKWGSMSF